MREAGDRARLLRAWPTAARRYAAALELWPAGDPARPELLLRLGEARFNGEQQGAPELEEASAALLAAGNRDAAAHAETLLAFIAFFRGDGEGRNRHGLRAFELVRDQPPSSAKAAVLTRMASNLMMTDQVPQSLGLASQALAVARAVDDPELAYTLTVNGLARTRAGDPGGIEDLEAAALLAESQRSSHSEYFWVQVVTGYGWIADLGPRAAAAMARSEQAAERFGSVPGRRINVDSVRAMYFYVVGDWPAALASAERVIAFPLPFFMKTPCRLARGRVRLGAGDVEGAAEDARVALEIARVSGHSGLLQPALSFSAFMAMSAGRTEEAAKLTAELADGLSIGFVHCDSGVDMGLALARFGYGPELFDAEGMVRTGFTRGVRAVVAGEYAAAAEIYGGFGARADEARCRVLDAERLLAEGRDAEAADQLVAAAAFYDDAGATAHRDAVDRLLVRAGAADPIG